ncbi:hypothetical protein D3C77_349410 [compost metagenome]
MEVFEDLAGVLAERLHVAHQVGGGLGVGQRAEGQRRAVEELLAGSAQQNHLANGIGAAFLSEGLLDHLILGRREHTLHAPQQGERQYDAAVLGLLEVTAQQIGNGPKKRGRLGMIFRVHATTPWNTGKNASLTRRAGGMSQARRLIFSLLPILKKSDCTQACRQQ